MSAKLINKRAKKQQLPRSRVSAPMLSNEAKANLQKIGESMGGISIPNLLAQVGEASKNGKPENWIRAVAAFQDAIEK